MCSVPSGGPLIYDNITFVYNSEQLNGTQRVLLDNVLSEDQCRELHSVANVRTPGRVGPDYAGLLQACKCFSAGLTLSQRTRPAMSLSLVEGH